MTSKNLHILLIEDNLSLSELYRRFFTRAGHKISIVCDVQDALNSLAENSDISLIILDLDFDPDTSFKCLLSFRENYEHCPVIAVTGAASVGRAVEAMKAGASDFLIKPFPVDKLSKAIEDACAKIQSAPHSENDNIQARIPSSSQRSAQDPYFGGFIGASAKMRDVYKLIENAAKSDAGVFITGASGTGKEICAEAIHKYSPRAGKNFVALNCAAIPENLIESELFGHTKGAFTGATSERKGAAIRADGGTLFLDEICEMHPDTQAKLLRFLQDQRFTKVGGDKELKTDVRIICATNKNPLEAVQQGKFREDLYYRLHVVPIDMPLLKDRDSDILDLAEFFLRRFSREEGKDFIRLDPDVENILIGYHWPGNVRQLENLIRQVVVLNNGPYVTLEMLPGYLTLPNCSAEEDLDDESLLSGDGMTLEDVERQTILKAIELYSGNITKAAEHLGVSPSTLYRKKTAWEKNSGVA